MEILRTKLRMEQQSGKTKERITCISGKIEIAISQLAKLILGSVRVA